MPGVPEFSTTVAILAYVTENAMPVPTLAQCKKIYNYLILLMFSAIILVTAQFPEGLALEKSSYEVMLRYVLADVVNS